MLDFFVKNFGGAKVRNNADLRDFGTFFAQKRVK